MIPHPQMALPLQLPRAMRPLWTHDRAGRVVELESALRALLAAVGAIWAAEGVDEEELAREARRASNVLTRGQPGVRVRDC